MSKQDHDELYNEHERTKSQLAKVSQMYADQQQDLAVRTADLSKLTSVLLSDPLVFERLVAATAVNGPTVRAARIVKVCWDNTIDKKPSGPKATMDYVRDCVKQHG